MLIGRSVGRVAYGGFGGENRPDGVELENNLFEPELVGYENQNTYQVSN